MFARYFFILVGIISVIWIGYVAVDIIDKKNAYSPTTLFGVEDGDLLIINRKKEVNRDLVPFKTTKKNTELLNTILPHLKDERSIFISANRSHFLVESKFHWSKEKIKTLFLNSGLDKVVQNLKSFSLDDYKVTYHKNYLYFSLENYVTNTLSEWGKFDKKASASLIHFQNNQTKSTDIYFKGENTIEYHSKNEANLKGKQINDKDLFSPVLPSTIDNYHFFEKFFLSNSDEAFSKSPMFQWMDKGYVSFNYKGQQVIISDFITGQDPINVLFDHLKKDAENVDHTQFFNIKLTSTFPKNERSGFFIYNLNDFVVISENQSICEEIIKENKLGNTLATNYELAEELFKGLPKLVSERVINTEEKFSRTVYKSKIFETRLYLKPTPQKEIVKNNATSISMNVNETINDFMSFEGQGNCLAHTNSGNLLSFTHGKLDWKKALPGKLIGKIQYINALGSIIITNSQSIHLLNRQGNYTWGSSIELQGKTPVQAATFYQWKGKNYIVYPSENGELIVYDSNRKQHAIIKSNLINISEPIDVWVSQKKLFFGVHNGSIFKMFEAEKKKEFRSFSLPGKSVSVVKGSEIKLFTLEGSNFMVIDQKGNKNNLNHRLESEITKINPVENEIHFMSKNGSTLSFFDSDGKFSGKFVVDFSDLENIDVKTVQGRNIVSVVDGLENNVYLYQLNGKKIADRSFEGSKKTTISGDKNSLFLTTIVDNYLIQYLINY